MFTSIDKAIVALFMAVVFLINNLTDINLVFSEGTINAVAGVLTPVLVWLFPNKNPKA